MASTIKLVAGIIIILIGFPIFIGGSAILLVTPILADNDGYFMSPRFHYQGENVSAIRIDIPLENIQVGMQIDPSDFVTLKVNVYQAGNAPAFIGLTTSTSADLLLDTISYAQIYNLDFDFDSEFRFEPDSSINELQGFTMNIGSNWTVPDTSGPWLAGGYIGHTSIWEPSYSDLTVGTLSLILMNSDLGASGTTDLTFSIGARVPIINVIGMVIAIFGGLITLLGVIVVWSGLRSKPSHARRTRYYQGAPVTRVTPIERAPSQFQLQCSNCGAINEQDSSFCSQCGEILLTEDRTTVQTAVKETKLDTFEPTSNKLVVAEWGPRFWAFIIDMFIISAVTSA
ncbi:MAG: zinc ribbon domain-containing protein, partial [Candidatus Kariarchaeaceae archaeon]